MKIIYQINLILFVVIFSFGCASKAYLPTHPDSPDYGTITLFRVNEEPTAPRLDIYTDNKKIAALTNHGTVTFSLPIGSHSLSIDWSNTDRFFDDIVSIDLKGKNHYYIAIIHCFNVSNYKRHARREEWLMGEFANAIILDKESALEIINKNIL